MPRYFFNFDNGPVVGSSDLVGRDLPDDEAAKIEAARLAADLSVDGALEGETPAFEWIEIGMNFNAPLHGCP